MTAIIRAIKVNRGHENRKGLGDAQRPAKQNFACMSRLSHLNIGSAELKEMLHSLKPDVPRTDKLYIDECLCRNCRHVLVVYVM